VINSARRVPLPRAKLRRRQPRGQAGFGCPRRALQRDGQACVGIRHQHPVGRGSWGLARGCGLNLAPFCMFHSPFDIPSRSAA
jgi:hypothetical protein